VEVLYRMSIELIGRTTRLLPAALLSWIAIATPLHGNDEPIGPTAVPSSVIASAAPDGAPIVPFKSNGDLWLNTWADDGNLYSGWGDGQGPGIGTPSDCGIARLLGDAPNILGEIRCTFAPKTKGFPKVNDKPSSLLFLDGKLVGAFHSPLGDAWIGYLAVSQDLGTTWRRLGFYGEKETPPSNASPWTRERKSNFRCLFFINMGRSYELNTDGYVYAMGIGMEWNWASRNVYLCRVPREKVLDYSAYSYFAGMNGQEPKWSSIQEDARPLGGVEADQQGSAMFHPQLGRYLFLTQRKVFDAPAPWGPWTLSGAWNGLSATSSGPPVEWQGGYMPGIISKDTGPDWFWFTISGQNKLPKITYRLQLGKMRMVLRPSPDARVTVDPVSQSVGVKTDVDFSVAAAGDGPFAYQWQKNGTDVAGATQPEMTIKTAQLSDSGNYHCTVSNSHGRAVSGDATLSVIQYCAP
jgi:hypothetical protein